MPHETSTSRSTASPYYDHAFLAYGSGRTLSLDESHAAGFHDGTVAADPRFVDPAAADYRLPADSFAFMLGFQELPYEAMGPAGLARAPGPATVLGRGSSGGLDWVGDASEAR